MFTYRIEEVCFSDSTRITPGPLTVIVGPNNSGKSRALRDIESLATGSKKTHLVVTGLQHSLPRSGKELLDAYKVESHTDESNNVFLRSLSSTMTTQHNIHVGHEWETTLEGFLSTQDANSRTTFAAWFGNMFVSMFSTEGGVNPEVQRY